MSDIQDKHLSETYTIPTLPLPYDLETKEVLKQVNKANRKLAELKGVAQAIPNERILISSLTLQEAKDICRSPDRPLLSIWIELLPWDFFEKRRWGRKTIISTQNS